MTNWDFLSLLTSNIQSFICSFVSSFCIYYYCFRNVIHSILDPLFWSLLGSCFGFSVVSFLFLLDQISIYYYSSYLLTQFSFIIFLLIGMKHRISIINPVIIINKSYFLYCFFFISLFVDIFCQTLTLYLRGIPILMESRLETFSGGTGYGLFSRFLDISRCFTLYFVFYFWFFHKFRRILKVYIIYLFLVLVASGSKSSVLSIGVLYFCYVFSNRITNGLKGLSRITKLLIPISILGALLMLYIRLGSFTTSIIELLARFVFYGDIYWQAYPNDFLSVLNDSSPFKALFSDFLGSFRLIDWANLPTPIGIDLYKSVHSVDLMTGPNARHNVFGLLYFGYAGSCLFSAVIGLCTGFFRQLCLSFSGHSHIIKALAVILYIKMIALETDPTLAVTGLVSILMVFPILLFLSFCVFMLFDKSGLWEYQ